MAQWVPVPNRSTLGSMARARQIQSERRAQIRDSTRTNIISAAREVAKREGAARLSLRSVAAEAGFAPAALYVYFRNKNDLILALAADDLADIAQLMREAYARGNKATRSWAAVSATLDVLSKSETLAAAASALNSQSDTPAGRLFNGRLIAVLSALAAITGAVSKAREGQADVLLTAAVLTGLAMLVRSGRLKALGFAPDEVLARLPHWLEGTVANR
jgi:AcrR family transcriptional regulator